MLYLTNMYSLEEKPCLFRSAGLAWLSQPPRSPRINSGEGLKTKAAFAAASNLISNFPCLRQIPQRIGCEREREEELISNPGQRRSQAVISVEKGLVEMKTSCYYSFQRFGRPVEWPGVFFQFQTWNRAILKFQPWICKGYWWNEFGKIHIQIKFISRATRHGKASVQVRHQVGLQCSGEVLLTKVF